MPDPKKKKLKREIERLKEFIHARWAEMDSRPMSKTDHHELKRQTVLLMDELKGLLGRMEKWG
jgi:hypothetical protein